MKEIREKMSRFNPLRPYVWEMKITEAEFRSLEEDLCAHSPIYTKKDDALKTLVYLAEWYKRRYTNRSKKAYQATFGNQKPDLKAVWETLGIDTKYLYEGEGGQKLYLYSTFILSGLSIQLELQKNEKPFLRSLCRVFNGEEDNYEVDTNHSIAFKESVKSGHCLDRFLKTIIKHINEPEQLPFAIEDYNNTDTGIKDLTKLIKDINDSIQKSKFRLEWIFNAPQGDDLISRHLRLWLNPNKGDASKRHVYYYDEVREKWGVAKPEEQRYIKIGLRFLSKIGSHETIVVKNADSAHPACMFRNAGEQYFIASEPDYAVVKDIPVCYFNQIQIVCWDDEGSEYPIVTEDINLDAVQLYRIEKYEDLWTDRALPQRETVVLFSDKYSIADESDDKAFERKTLYYKKYGEGYHVNWCPVNITVILQDEKGKLLDPFVNKQTKSCIDVHLWKESIVYLPDGKLTWIKKDLDSEEEEEDSICLITKKEDISVRFCGKGDSEDDECKMEIIPADTIEFKSTNGHYVEWTDDCIPAFGVNYVRVYARHQLINKNEVFPVFYLPGGVSRDCENRLITYVDDSGSKVTIDDSNDIQSRIVHKQVLPVTKTVVVTNGGENTLIVPVVRPVIIKEVCYDGKILMYDENGEVTIPYILKEYVDVNDYGKDGYHSYSCKDFRNVFVELNNSEYRTSGKYTSAIDGKTFTDGHAPEGVTFFVRKTLSRNPRLRYCYWDCKKDSKPIPVRDLETFELPSGNVLFQDQRSVSHRLQCEYMEKEATGFAKIRRKGSEENDPVFEVFSVASEYNQYFFHFKALRTLANGISEGKRDFYEEIYNPLLEYHHNNFSMRDKKELLRFADEFCLDSLKEQLITKFINIL